METMESEEQIQQQMTETRASLADKLETLEEKVVGTVTDATTAVNETVDVIKDSVQETVSAVNDTVKESVETVKDWVDVKAHVREHPWLMVGGSVAVGYCLGRWSRKTAQMNAESPVNYPARMEHFSNGGSREERLGARASQAPAKSTLSTWGPEIDKLKSLAIGVLFGTAREMITSSVSEHVGEQLREIIDSATKKVGGEPIPSADWVKQPQELTAHEGEEERSETEAQWQAHGTGVPTARRW